MFLATTCHDLDHPGNSNNFEIHEQTPVAQKFPDSPLENHHVELACRLFDELGLLADIDETSRISIRHGVAQLILATDMAKHGAVTGRLQDLNSSGKAAVAEAKTDHNKKILVLQNVLKCADISNQCRVLACAKFWNECVYSEFYAEGDNDKK